MMTATEIAEFNYGTTNTVGAVCPLCKSAIASPNHLVTWDDASLYTCPCCHFLEEQDDSHHSQWPVEPQTEFECSMVHLGYSSREVVDHR